MIVAVPAISSESSSKARNHIVAPDGLPERSQENRSGGVPGRYFCQNRRIWSLYLSGSSVCMTLNAAIFRPLSLVASHYNDDASSTMCSRVIIKNTSSYTSNHLTPKKTPVQYFLERFCHWITGEIACMFLSGCYNQYDRNGIRHLLRYTDD